MVLFPLPLSPTRATISPLDILKETSLTAIKSFLLIIYLTVVMTGWVFQGRLSQIIGISLLILFFPI